MAFAHVQMMTYRPFIHYTSRGKQGVQVKGGYSAGTSCISVATKIVHVADEMRKEGYLNGAYWFSMYTTFFATISLLYYVFESPSSSPEYLRTAEVGRNALDCLREKSWAADRCSMILKVCKTTVYFLVPYLFSICLIIPYRYCSVPFRAIWQ